MKLLVLTDEQAILLLSTLIEAEAREYKDNNQEAKELAKLIEVITQQANRT